MKTTYGDLRGYRGYSPIAYTCAGARARDIRRAGNNPANPANPATLTHQVGAGAKISAKPANPTAGAKDRDVAERGADPKHSQLLHDLQMVPSPRLIAEDRGGNGREDSLCLLQART